MLRVRCADEGADLADYQYQPVMDDDIVRLTEAMRKLEGALSLVAFQLYSIAVQYRHYSPTASPRRSKKMSTT